MRVHRRRLQPQRLELEEPAQELLRSLRQQDVDPACASRSSHAVTSGTSPWITTGASGSSPLEPAGSARPVWTPTCTAGISLPGCDQVRCRLGDQEGRSHGTLGIVLVRHRIAKQATDRPPACDTNVPSSCLTTVAQASKNAADEVGEVFGLHLLGHAHQVGQIHTTAVSPDVVLAMAVASVRRPAFARLASAPPPAPTSASSSSSAVSKRPSAMFS